MQLHVALKGMQRKAGVCVSGNFTSVRACIAVRGRQAILYSIDVFSPSTATKATYINVGIGKNNSDRYFEIRLNKDNLEIEAGDNDLELGEFTQDEWHTVQMSWTNTGIFTIILDGINGKYIR